MTSMRCGPVPASNVFLQTQASISKPGSTDRLDN
jgi:hypothetical protein